MLLMQTYLLMMALFVKRLHATTSATSWIYKISFFSSYKMQN